MNLSALFLALVELMGTVFQCPGMFGFPAWGRPELEVGDLPLVAVQLSRFSFTAPKRQGETPRIRGAVYDVFIFAKDELELANELGLFVDWLPVPEFDVNSVRTVLSVVNAERHVPETTIQQEQHGFVLTLSADW